MYQIDYKLAVFPIDFAKKAWNLKNEAFCCYSKPFFVCLGNDEKAWFQALARQLESLIYIGIPLILTTHV